VVKWNGIGIFGVLSKTFIGKLFSRNEAFSAVPIAIVSKGIG